MGPTKETKLIRRGKNGDDPSPPTREESVIIVPMIEDSVVGLGDLYDCRTNLCPGNLFSKPFTSDSLEAFPLQSLEYTLFQSKNTSDKMQSLNVSAEISLDMALSNGSLKISGSAAYESNDNKKFNQEELLCTYNASTYCIRTKPSTIELVDQLMLNKLIDGEIIATHYVQSVRVGAQASASIRVSERIEDKNMNVSGNFNLDLVVGSVNIKAKAEMKMLDKEYSENYETAVNVKTRPRFQKAPTNVTQMFNEIDTLGDRLDNEMHFPTLPHVVGVPLTFKLVPLHHFIDYRAEALYRLLAEGIMKDFTSMVYTLQDFLTPGYIKSLIREKDPRIVTILKDVSNPYTEKVTALEKECDEKAREIKAKAFEVFALYKEKKAEDTDIQDVLTYYDEYFKIYEIMAQILDLVQEGKRELAGIHASDVIDLKGPVHFFSNDIDLKDWWEAERTIKILLQTNFEYASPSGTFLRLFNLAGPLSDLGVEIGIAFPNVSLDFSITFKIRDKEVVYRDSDIVFALDVLAIAIENGDAMSSLFIVLNGILSGLNMTSVVENLPDINSLVSIFKESRDTRICETYPQLLEILGQTTNTWNFVIPLQGINCSIEMMKFFRQLRESLPQEHPKVQHQWIIGRFNVEQHFDSPLLFVFKDEKLKGICLDRLDILILLNQFKSSPTSPDLSILGHESLKIACLYPPRANFAIKILEGLVLDHSTTLTELIPPLVEFPKEIQPQHAIALDVTRGCAMRNELQVLNTIATISAADYPDLIVIFREFGWSDQGFPHLGEEIKWGDLHSKLETFLGDQAPYLVKVEGAIKSLRPLKVPEDGDPEKIKQLKTQIIEIVKPIAPNFGATGENFVRITRVAAKYKFRGISIDEEEEFEELRGELESFQDCEISIMLRGVLAAFERFYNSELEDEDNNFYNLVQLILLTEKLGLEERTFKPLMIDLAKKYCMRALKKFNPEEYPEAEKKINDAILEKNLFKTLGFLALFTQHHLLYKFTEEIYNLHTLDNIEPVKLMIENMNENDFSEKQIKTIWTNPKFLYLIRYGIGNDALLKTIYVELCIENQAIPRFIPSDIAEKLKPLFFSMEEPQFEWTKEWAKVSDAVETFQIIVTRKFIPSLFPRALRQNIEDNEEIRNVFFEQDALFYWDENDKYFKHPWSLKTTGKALALIAAADAPGPKLKPKSLSPAIVEKLRAKVTVTAKSSPPTTPTDTNESKKIPPISVSRQSSVLSDKSDESESKSSDLPVAEIWKRFTHNGLITKFVGDEFGKVQIEKPKPLVEYDQLNKTFDEILVYLVQEARLHDSISIQPSHIVDLIKYPPADGKPRPGFIDFGAGAKRNNNNSEGEKFLMSKSDLLTVLFNCVDPLVAHNILCSLIKAPIALPLIIPGILASSAGFKLVLPALQNLVVNELSSIVPHPHLLNKPFRLVLAIRVGDVSGKLSKSTMINQMLMKHQNFFSCFAEPGMEHGKPIARGGLVEFTWLSKSKVDSEFYQNVIQPHYERNEPDMLLLGNLHGNAMDYQPILELLNTFTSSFIVFWKANNWNDLKAKKTELNKVIGNGSSVLDLVIYPDPTIIEHVDQQNIISMATPEEMNASKLKLQNIIKVAIESKAKFPTNNSRIQDDGYGSSDLLTFADPGILNFMKQCKTTKGGFIPFRISQFEDDNISCPESHRLIQYINFHTIPKIKEALKNIDEQNETILTGLEEFFLAVLSLPNPKRNMAFTHFNYELDYLSTKSSKLAIERLLKLRVELDALGGQIDEDEILELQNDIKAILTRLEQTTLCPQDIFRYFITQYSSDEFIQEKYFEYITSRFAIELFQPSHGAVMWDEALETVFQTIPQDTKIFVISAIGLKAGGKSTLLNRLFGGSEFREGPAGSTHGLHMRFLWINEKYKKVLKCDAFLVIDSEGFGAPENLIDESADVNERQIATFILGLSHLTLANVFGDNMKELQGILESSFTTLTTINDLLLIPDMVLVQQEIEGSSGEKEFIGEWSEAMGNIKRLTRENEMRVGVRVREGYRMEIIKARFKHEQLIHSIRPLTQDAELNSGGYYKDIQSLHSKIINMCINSTQISTLGEWYSFSKSHWSNVKEHQIPNSYKSATAMEAGILVNQKIRIVKSAIDAAFRVHDKIIDDYFTTELDEYLSSEEPKEPKDDVELRMILQRVRTDLGNVINSCTIGEEGGPCPECLNAFTLRESLFAQVHNNKRQFIQIVTQVNDYVAQVDESLWSKYKQRVIAKQIQTGIIRDEQKDELHLVWEQIMTDYPDREVGWVKYKQYVSTRQTVIPATHLIDAEVGDEYLELPHIIQRLSDEYPRPNLERLIAFDIGHYNNALESSVNSRKRETLTWDKHDYLMAKMEDLPSIILTDNGVNGYLVGMVRELQTKMNDVLETFQTICGEQLQPNFKWEAHLHVIKMFKTFMQAKQDEWDQTHNPLIQLEIRKAEFEHLFKEL